MLVFHYCEICIQRTGLIFFNITNEACLDYMQNVLEKQSFSFCIKTNLYDWRRTTAKLHIKYITTYRMKTAHFTEFVYYTQNSRNQNMVEHNTIQYNTIKLYCPEPGNSFCSVRRHKNIKYRVEI